MIRGAPATRARDLRGLGPAPGRHWPEETVLYSALQAHWKTFVSELEAMAERPVLPAFIPAPFPKPPKLEAIEELLTATAKASPRPAAIRQEWSEQPDPDGV